MSELSKEQELEMLKRAAESLGEHFETVQIFTTRHEAGNENGTVHLAWGAGNWFARYGHVRNWLIMEDESSREGVRRREL